MRKRTMPYNQASLAVGREHQWRLKFMTWRLKFSRDKLREQVFWYRKSFVLLFCGMLFIAMSNNSLQSKLRLRQLELSEQFRNVLKISHPQDSVYSIEEQMQLLMVLNESLAYDSTTFDFVKTSFWKETSVTGSACDESAISWKGLKISPEVFTFPFKPNCDIIKPDTLTLLYIYSRVTSFSQRELIRSTWANENFTRHHNISVIFIISYPNYPEHQQNVEVEQRMHGDLLQVNVPETYDNLAFKSAASLAWISRCGRHVPTIAKVDDDSIPNIILLQEMYRHRLQTENVVRNLIYCKKLTRINVKRTYNFMGKYKNIVTPEEFEEDYFPPYCQGRVVFMTSDVALALFNVFLHNEIFRVDDVYLSGLLRSKTCVNITDHYSYNTTFIKPLQWRGLFIDFSVFSATLYAKLGLDITLRTSNVDMPEDLMNEL